MFEVLIINVLKSLNYPILVVIIHITIKYYIIKINYTTY